MLNSRERRDHHFSQMLATQTFFLSDLKQPRAQLSNTAQLSQSKEAPRKILLIFCPLKGGDGNRPSRISKILGQRPSVEAGNSLKTLSVDIGGSRVPGGWSPF